MSSATLTDPSVTITWTHALSTSDGEHLVVSSGPEQSVVEAAEAAGLLLPSSCRAGSCGACHARAEGAYEMRNHSETVLDDEAAANGEVLLCCTYAKGAMNITLPYESNRIISGKIPTRQATVTAVDVVAADTVRLELQLGPDERGALGCEFDPGQFLELVIPGTATRRSYSLANNPNWGGTAELFIKLREGGVFSEWLRDVQPGQQLEVRGAQGAFGVRDSGLRPRWFFAGGTGLSPLLSMLRRMADWEEPHAARLFFGVETEEEIFGVDVLHELAAKLPDFRYEVVLGKSAQGWDGKVGTPLDTLAADLAEAPEAPDIYVCGPPGMVAAARKIAKVAGLPEERVIIENFAPSA